MNELRDLIFQDKKEPASLAEIEALEAVSKVKLPEDYRRFLLTYNGGWEPRFKFFPVYWRNNIEFPWAEGGGFVSGLNSAEATLRDFRENFSEHIDSEEEDDVFPLHDLELDYSESGRLFLGLADDAKYKVYFWSSEIDINIHHLKGVDFQRIRSENRQLQEFGGLVADSFSDFLTSALTTYEYNALFASPSHYTRLRNLCEETLLTWKEKGKFKWLPLEQIEISFYHILLKDFRRAEEQFTEMLKGLAEHQIEPDTYLDWRNWSEYVELAKKELKAGMKDWRFRFARRLHGVDPDEHPLLVPQGHDYSEILNYRDRWITGD